jgi:2-polyprenyl-6-methoxyphenol hydroxylase-like FAD-dependent oxidoreductase
MALPVASGAPHGMSVPWQVVVVGAGVAGAYVAARLAYAGVSVLLVDRGRFPRNKVCGACLSGRALAVLKRCPVQEVANIPEKSGMKHLGRVRIGTGAGTVELPLGAGGALSRDRLDAGLVSAARHSGATVWEETEALSATVFGSYRRVRMQRLGETVEVDASLVIAAEGLGGRILAREESLPDLVSVNSRVGAGCVLPGNSTTHYESDTIHMACGKYGYLGLVRQEDDSLDLAMAADQVGLAQSGGPARLAAKILEGCQWPVPVGMMSAPWRGTPRLTHQRNVGASRLVVVGDAAAYVEPFTGEGMGWALEAAENLVPLVLDACSSGSLDQVHNRWQTAYRKLSTPRKKFVCSALAWGLRRPACVDATVCLLRLVPALAWPVTWLLDRQSLPRPGTLS